MSDRFAEDFAVGFVPGPSGRLFLTKIAPPAPTKGSLLIVPPFAEEMNCSRRFMSGLARALAKSGVACWIVDLWGTGDSEGDFATADLNVWCADIAHISAWLAERDGAAPRRLGIRLGASLAAAADQPAQALIMIQPVLNGQTFTTQFLRVRIAAGMAAGRRETAKQLREISAKGTQLSVAGYRLSPSLVSQLDGFSLDQVDIDGKGLVSWYETQRTVAEDAPRRLSPPQAWLAHVAHDRLVAAEPFWSIQEPTVPPGLIETVCADLQMPVAT